MKIYDCITFFNELDLLELRMHELDPYVDYFVINEVNMTFSGKPKPFYFEENKERFKQWEHKILHGTHIDLAGDSWNNWDRDREHKNLTANILRTHGCTDEDIIMFSDADEIPNLRPFNLDEFGKMMYGDPWTKECDPVWHGHLYMLRQNCYMYYMNVFYEDMWRGTKFSTYATLKDWSFDQFRDFNSDFHRNHSDKVHLLDNGGWHFSFLGGIDKVLQKIESWGHQEYNNDMIKGMAAINIANNKDIFFRGNFQPKVVPLDDTYPKHVLENIDHYKALGFFK